MNDPLVRSYDQPISMRVKIVAAVSILVGLPALYLWYVYFVGPWSLLYEFEGRFDQLPENDERLITAIRAEPRVIEHTVEVDRQDDGRVNARFGIGGPLIPRPMPNLDKICAQLGYERPVQPFQEILHRAFRDSSNTDMPQDS